MSKSQGINRTYSEEERLSLLREFKMSGMGRHSFCKLHGIKSTSSLSYWEKKYESEKDLLPLQPEPDEDEMSFPWASPQHWSVQTIPTYVLATNIWQVFRIVDSL